MYVSEVTFILAAAG